MEYECGCLRRFDDPMYVGNLVQFVLNECEIFAEDRFDGRFADVRSVREHRYTIVVDERRDVFPLLAGNGGRVHHEELPMRGWG